MTMVTTKHVAFQTRSWNDNRFTVIFLAFLVINSLTASASSENGNLRRRYSNETLDGQANDGLMVDVAELAERMAPRNLQTTSTEEKTFVNPKQFLHLHHMKSGGTSMNRLMQCAMDRLREQSSFLTANENDVVKSFQLDYYSLSECQTGAYHACMTKEDAKCREFIGTSAVMQYCAPLQAVNHLGWNDTDAITVIRHPVDRIWSLYRYMTKRCYQCLTLTEVYEALDDGTFEEKLCGGNGCTGSCTTAQLVNHITRNLLSTAKIESKSDEEQLENALWNLQNRFVVVGLTEDLETTVQMVQHSFPWMAAELESNSTICTLPHANASPENNRCGPSETHMPIPDHPDEETREIIMRHNPLDVAVYEAAVKHFQMQKLALGWDEGLE